MAKLYSISIRWVKTPVTQEAISAIDTHLRPAGDWVRFDGWQWLLWSQYGSAAITNHLRLKLHPDDSLLVAAVDLDDLNGWAAEWIWDWIAAKKRERNVEVSRLSNL